MVKEKATFFQDRFKCFHNGIILIVICFILVITNIQIYFQKGVGKSYFFTYF